MLRHLKLANFRKHENLELNLEPGIVVMRAANEAGKTTLIEAVAYAMFGSKACRQPLDEVVTWGKPLNSLRVELGFEFDGVRYELKRSKSGAELAYEGGTVTGQSEVTGFIERLMGAPANLATSLWFANQGTIRGALEAGPKATAQLIEQLADFGIVDKLLELIQNKLPTGVPKPFEERVKQAQDYVDSLSETVPVPGEDEVKWLFEAERELPKLAEEARYAAEASEKFDREVFAPLVAKRGELDRQRSELVSIDASIKAKSEEQDALVIPPFNEKALQEARSLLTQQQVYQADFKARKEAHTAFSRLPKAEDAVWDGDRASYDAFKAELACKQNETSRAIAEAEYNIRLFKQQVVQANVCGMCGKDVSEFPEVAARNAEIQAGILKLEAELERLKEERHNLEQQAQAVAEINRVDALYTAFLKKYGSKVTFLDTAVPPELVWMGGDTSEEMDGADYAATITRLEAEKRKHDQTTGRRQLLGEQVAALSMQRVQVEGKIRVLESTVEGYDEAASKALSLTHAKVVAQEAYDELKVEHKERSEAFQNAVNLYEVQQKNLESAQQMLSSAKAQLIEVNFNNALLKKIRASRPVVVDRLWQVVLSAVTYYFGQMRGVQSAVTRSDGGFKVDGQAVEGLSGSTLDILGLSIRLALLKTFLPRCGFLVLDEPAAACDDGREAALIGTIAASSFEQTLIVTHSDLADAYANQLVTL